MISPTDNRPRIVIVGRPNVGKSTLFNRLYGRRRAITDPTPGVTRDSLEEDADWDGRPVKLVDTGGIKAVRDEDFDDVVAEKSVGSIEGADVVLFLVDIRGWTGEDQAITQELRRRADRVVLVANKADTPEKDLEAEELHALGFGEPIPVSATHGRNMDRLLDAVSRKLEQLPSREPGLEEESPPEVIVALVGKPNAGKSTLANLLTGIDGSIVSPLPGTTRDVVRGEFRYRGRRIRVLDTAGIRRKKNVAENVEYYSVNRAIRAMAEADVTVHLLDAVEGLSDQDKKIAAQAVKRGKTVVMALNKWDAGAGDPGKEKKRFKTSEERIRFQFPVLDWSPIIPISALDGSGIDNLLGAIMEADRQQRKRVETGEVNRALAEWVDLTPLPTRKGKPFKVKYLTQVSAPPVRFVAFVNRKKGFPDSYRRFLINKIRKEFGFTQVPVSMELREGKR